MTPYAQHNIQFALGATWGASAVLMFRADDTAGFVFATAVLAVGIVADRLRNRYAPWRS